MTTPIRINDFTKEEASLLPAVNNLSNYPTNSPLDLENKLYHLIDQIRTNEIEQAQKEGREYHIHGLCAVLGYDPKHHAEYFTMPVGDDLFTKKNIYLDDLQALETLQQAMAIDGAILINSEGKIVHSGRFMQADLRIYSRHETALSTYRQLRETADAGTRHLAAIALSAQLPNLSFYTLKSDHPQLRVFRNGSIVSSTILDEVITGQPKAT